MVLLNRRKYIHRRRPQGAPADLADAVVTLASETVYYTGNPVYPSVSVTYEGAALVVNTDYTLNYSDNTEVGAATVVVTGMGEYTGSVVKTFQIVAAGEASWANFDLSNLGVNSHVASAKLYDSTAIYARNYSIDAYSIQLLADGRLVFGGQAQGHEYIWGFEDGHPFEVEYFKSTYDSKSSVIDYNGSFIMSPDGLAGVVSFFGKPDLKKVAFSTAFDLSTMSVADTVAMSAGWAENMAFSSDGTKFFNKKSGEATLWCRHLNTPYVVDSYSSDENTSVDLNSAAGLGSGEGLTWRGFCFSPDGRFMVATSGSGAGKIHKFALSTPWDITTMNRVSYATVFENDGHYLESVIVNAQGTKMIVCDGRNRGHYGERTFYEYNLTA